MSLYHSRPQGKQLEFQGDFVTAAIPIPQETDRLYSRTARHIASELAQPDFPKDVIMGAVLAAPVETDLVMGFLNGDLEVVSQSTASLDLLKEELDALAEGRWEFSLGGLRREGRAELGKTRLQQFKAAHPETVKAVQALETEILVDLVLELLMSRERERGILPRYLKALSQRNPQQYGQVISWLKSAKTRRNLGAKATAAPRHSPRP